MAHEIDFSNNRANIAYIHKKPWHGLGQKLPEDTDIDQWKIAAGMNWTIEESQVMFQPNGSPVYEQFPEKKALFRSDNQRPLSVVSEGFNVVQPGDALEFFRDLVEDSRYTIDVAGVLQGGKKFWALAKANYQITLGGNDIIEPYLLMATSCDGTMSTVVDPTTVRVVCANTLRAAVGDGQLAQIRVPHKKVFDGKRALRSLGLLDDVYETFAENADQLSQRKVDRKTAIEFFANLYTKFDRDGSVSKKNQEAAENKVVQLMSNFTNGPGAQLDTAHGTAWGLVNAVTAHQDHHVRSGSDRRFNSAQFGNGRRIKDRAWTEALKLVA